MTAARPFAVAEEDNPAALLVGMLNELQQVIDPGQIRNLDAATAASNLLIAEFFQPTISLPAERLFERVTAESWRPYESMNSDISENRRPFTAAALDRIDRVDEFPR